jgi:hypothetical protein
MPKRFLSRRFRLITTAITSGIVLFAAAQLACRDSKLLWHLSSIFASGNAMYSFKAPAPSKLQWFGNSAWGPGYRNDRYMLVYTKDHEAPFRQSRSAISPTDVRYWFSHSRAIEHLKAPEFIGEIAEHYRGFPFPWIGTRDVTLTRIAPPPTTDAERAALSRVSVFQGEGDYDMPFPGTPRAVIGWDGEPIVVIDTPTTQPAAGSQRSILWLPATLSLAFWLTLGTLFSILLFKLIDRSKRRRGPEYCLSCGYYRKDLAVCPECGFKADKANSLKADLVGD